MATAARLAFAAWRNELHTFTIRVVGMDLTGKPLRMQVRQLPDTPGAPLIALEKVETAAAEGLRFQGVEMVDGIPVSTISGRFNKSTMSNPAKLPPAAELGDNAVFHHAIQLDGTTRIYGTFIALANVMDSNNHPSGSSGYGRSSQHLSAPWSDAEVVFSGGTVAVTVDGVGLLAPLISRTEAAAAEAEADRQEVAALAAATADNALLASTSHAAIASALAAAGIPPGDLAIPAASRTILAAITGQSAGLPVILTEGGRAGVFVWDPSNLSAKVADDALQGIYVAPASDASGASGAWVRRYSGAIDPRWFGAVADAATDCLPAINAAIASLTITDPNLLGTNGPEIFFPAGKYYFSGPINLKKGVSIRGVGRGMRAGHGTIFYFPANSHGIIINATNSDFGEPAPSTTSGATGLYGLQLMGSGNDKTKHGIYARGRYLQQDCGVDGFGGHGILVTAGGEDGGVGNANSFVITGGSSTNNGRSGLRVQGGDANAGIITALDVSYNTEWGVDDRSFLGNLYLNIHSSFNGNLGTKRTKPAVVTHDGKLWSVNPRHEAAASTEVPGTGAAWLRIINGEGVDLKKVFAPTAERPAWASGTEYLSGGAWCSLTGAAYGTVFLTCYSEAGQPQAFVPSPAFAIHGIQGAGIYGVHLGVAQDELISTIGFTSQQVLGDDFGRLNVGGFIGNEDFLRFDHPVRAPTTVRYRQFGTVGAGFQTGNNDHAWLMTGGATSWAFGRDTPQIGKFQANEIFVGFQGNARSMTSDSAPPTTGFHAKGEVVWNNGDNAANDAVDYWRCTASGTPGVWAAKS